MLTPNTHQMLSLEGECFQSSMLYNYFKHGKLEPSEGRGIAEGVGQSRITKNLEGAPVDDALYVADQDIVNMVSR